MVWHTAPAALRPGKFRLLEYIPLWARHKGMSTRHAVVRGQVS